MSYGHDEYLFTVLDQSKSTLSPQAKKAAGYIIRFHSFYPWHTPQTEHQGYCELANETDWKFLPLLKTFQKSDLYSKSRKVPNMKSIQLEFGCLIQTYFPEGFNWHEVNFNTASLHK